MRIVDMHTAVTSPQLSRCDSMGCQESLSEHCRPEKPLRRWWTSRGPVSNSLQLGVWPRPLPQPVAVRSGVGYWRVLSRSSAPHADWIYDLATQMASDTPISTRRSTFSLGAIRLDLVIVPLLGRHTFLLLLLYTHLQLVFILRPPHTPLEYGERDHGKAPVYNPAKPDLGGSVSTIKCPDEFAPRTSIRPYGLGSGCPFGIFHTEHWQSGRRCGIGGIGIEKSAGTREIYG